MNEQPTTHQQVIILTGQLAQAVRSLSGKVSNLRGELVMDRDATVLLRQHVLQHAANLTALADGLPVHEEDR